MKIDFHRVISFIVVMFTLVSSHLHANQRTQIKASQIDVSVRLLHMDEEIHRGPLQSYQQLLAIENKFVDMSTEHQQWWLLRKAQTENLLYFYQDFNKTVAQANTLITPDTSLKIQSTLNIFQGLVYRRDAQYAEATRTFRQAMIQAKQGKLTYIYILAKQELAYTQSLTEMFESSLKDMQEAYLEAYALKDHFLIAIINETYGAIYGYMKDYEKSVEYYQKALNTYESLEYPGHIAEAVYGIAATYRYWQKYDLAIRYFKLYQEKIYYTPNTDISFYSAYGLGMTLAEKGECVRAIEVIDNALALHGLIDYDAELYKKKVHCYIELGQLEQAKLSLFKAEEIFISLPELMGTEWQLEVIELAAELAHVNNNDSDAFQLLKEYSEKHIELLKKNSSSQLANARVSMESERNLIEQALIKQQKKVFLLEGESVEQKELNSFYLFILMSCISFIVVAVIMVQYRNNKKMYALSIKDPLSTLYNRRYVFDYLATYLEGASIEKTELSVILLDIDDFKGVNDKYGHPVGDDVIKKIADIARDVFRAEDVIGRIGGEEFLCVLPRTDAKQCEAIAKRLLKKVSNQIFIKTPGLRVTVSIGISSLSERCPDRNSLYLHADEALYQAKHNGKNTVVIY
jgi:diguanylate cyclase (GGDEF)-like protein